MRIGKLFRYSLYLLVMTMVLFLFLTIYLYYFSNKPSLEIAYGFIVPVCMFVVSLFYSRKVHEKGLLRGIEIWVVYFALVLLMKVLFNYAEEINILQHVLYLPVSVLGGVLGVNMKQRMVTR